MADPDYFTTAEFRALPQMADTSKYPEARILAVAAALTETVEDEVGTSFIARNITETLTSCSGDTLKLKSPFVRSVTTLTLNGASVTVGGLLPEPGGLLRFKALGSAFTSGDRGNVVVTYVSGYSTTPPANIKEALMFAVRDRLIETNQDAGIEARRTAMTTPDGNTVSYVLAGSGNPTGYPLLDAAITVWRNKLRGFGFA